MASKRVMIRIGDIGRVVTGKTPPTADTENYGGKLPFITPSDMDGNKYIYRTARTISEKGAKPLKNLHVPPKTVFVSCIGSDMGKVGMTRVESVTNQQINSIVVKNGIDPDYIYYNLYSRKNEFQRLATSGSAQPILNKGHFSQLKIILPTIAEQRAIARVLGTLDEKIELNKKMNEILEAMARAIFKSWFIDFDPVHAKAKGRDPKLPKQITDLFPDSFEQSQLGEIPKGWRGETLGSILELAYGKGLREQDRRLGYIPVHGSNGQVGWHDKKLVDGPGIIVGRKGNPGIVTWSHTDFYPIDTTFYVVPKQKELSLYYLFYALQLQDLPSLNADSAVPGLNRHLAYMNLQVVPENKVVKIFDAFVIPVYKKIFKNEQEISILAAIRDTLLPKLLSGEIRIKDTEKFAEATI
ncbi:MAG: restriction endonuclease subunit S [Deltaproteobacteria bacterium]|nr:restriction endonuclease subunit S [Deltaproteobacteria bacterium]MCL5791906.1 restriction endonuclease subunit S [Deltaproteobacteria bacterium]